MLAKKQDITHHQFMLIKFIAPERIELFVKTKGLEDPVIEANSIVQTADGRILGVRKMQPQEVKALVCNYKN
jgi:hypothetical protein